MGSLIEEEQTERKTQHERIEVEVEGHHPLGLFHGVDSSNSLALCKLPANFHPILSGRSLGRSLRPAVVNSGERLPVLALDRTLGIAEKVCNHDALGIRLGRAVLVAASDLGALRHGILPVYLPDLHAANRLAIVPHRIVLPLALHLGQRIQEGAQVGTGCIKLAQGEGLSHEGEA